MVEKRIADPETGEILEGKLVAASEDDKWEEKVVAVLPTDVALIKVAPGMDVAIQSLGDEAIKLSMYANDLQVTDLESEKRATNDLVMCRDMIKQCEVELKRWMGPVRDAEAKIKEAFSMILAPLKTANETMTAKITAYRREEKRKADEAAEIARIKAEVARREAEAKGEVFTPVVEVFTPEQVKTHQAPLGRATMTGTWKFKWKDGLSQKEIMERLPLHYHIANDTLIGQMVRAKEKNNCTEADFGGVIEIYLDESVRITGKRG